MLNTSMFNILRSLSESISYIPKATERGYKEKIIALMDEQYGLYKAETMQALKKIHFRTWDTLGDREMYFFLLEMKELSPRTTYSSPLINKQ